MSSTREAGAGAALVAGPGHRGLIGVRAGQTDPPLLTGGSLQPIPGVRPFSRAVDFLTLTLGVREAEPLLSECPLCEEGKAWHGFRVSERRDVLGGKVWRRASPVTPSRAHGLEYESWEWQSEVAALNVARVRGIGSASRVDVNFDFEVSALLTAQAWFEAHALQHVSNVDLTWGLSGNSPHFTVYVGAPSSERRVRVYRKDVQQGGAWWWGPVLRVELQLRGESARDWWTGFGIDEEAAYAVAAGQIHRMTGVHVNARESDWSHFVQPEICDIAQGVFQFVKQYGELVDDLASSGVDVLALCADKPGGSRMAGTRSRKRREALQRVGPSTVESVVRRLLLESTGFRVAPA